MKNDTFEELEQDIFLANGNKKSVIKFSLMMFLLLTGVFLLHTVPMKITNGVNQIMGQENGVQK